MRDTNHRLATIPRNWKRQLTHPQQGAGCDDLAEEHGDGPAEEQAEAAAEEPAQEAAEEQAAPTIDLGSINRPGEFLDRLAEAGIGCRHPGRPTEIHAQWCDRRFEEAREAHNCRPPDNLVIPPELMRGHNPPERRIERRTAQ